MAGESNPLTAGKRLIFRLHSEVAWRDKVNYRSVIIAVDVLVRDHLSRLVKVACVGFARDESQGNPVAAYFQRRGLAESALIALAPNTISLQTQILLSTTHLLQTGPIQRSPGTSTLFTQTPTLPPMRTIPHSMFSSAATRRYVETGVVMGVRYRVFKLCCVFGI